MSLRVGVIGVGLIGRDHVQRFAHSVAGTEMVAVADVDVDRARQVASTVPGCTAEADGPSVIARDDVDAVVVATWGPTHEDLVLAAIAAGKPVFCEKPLATTQQACRNIMDAEVATGRRSVQVGFMRRFDPAYRALKGAVTRGDVGQPMLIHCAHRIGSVPSSWTTEMSVVDAAVHEIDISRWLSGEEIVAVDHRLPRHGKPTGGVVDPVVILLETESGILVDVEVLANGGFGYDIRGEVVGASGVASLPEASDVVLKSAGRRSDGIPPGFRDRFTAAYDVQFQEWADRTAAGLEPDGPSSWDGYVATTVADTVLESIRAGTRAAVNLVDKPDLYAR